MAKSKKHSKSSSKKNRNSDQAGDPMKGDAKKGSDSEKGQPSYNYFSNADPGNVDDADVYERTNAKTGTAPKGMDA
ncbi:MAG: hypothetical protein H7122_20450 [Chitinophagaceae bacterium]|nr:hypothetical protein [Chitinophagaceae bacterium]